MPLAELVELMEYAVSDSRYPTPSTIMRAETESRERDFFLPAMTPRGGG